MLKRIPFIDGEENDYYIICALDEDDDSEKCYPYSRMTNNPYEAIEYAKELSQKFGYVEINAFCTIIGPQYLVEHIDEYIQKGLEKHKDDLRTYFNSLHEEKGK